MENTTQGTLAKVNIIDAKTKEVISRNVTMEVDQSKSIKQINLELALFCLPRRFELVEWIK